MANVDVHAIALNLKNTLSPDATVRKEGRTSLLRMKLKEVLEVL